jgi:hypothetical protein
MHPSELNLNEELKIKWRLSAGSAQRRRDQPLMPLATAGIGSATGNRNAQRSQDCGKPMRLFVCRNNASTEWVKGTGHEWRQCVAKLDSGTHHSEKPCDLISPAIATQTTQPRSKTMLSILTRAWTMYLKFPTIKSAQIPEIKENKTQAFTWW